MNDLKPGSFFENVELSEDEKEIIIIDQVQLPNDEVYLHLNQLEDLYQAIKKLQIRGAPAIGIFAGYSMYVLTQQYDNLPFEQFYQKFTEDKEYLNSSRPTAVNLPWALNRIDKVVLENKNKDVKEIVRLIGLEAKEIHREDKEMCLKICEYGLTLLEDGDGVLTICNTGPLATSRGTAIGPLILGKQRGYDFKVFANETRPLLQGARLTTLELKKELM